MCMWYELAYRLAPLEVSSLFLSRAPLRKPQRQPTPPAGMRLAGCSALLSAAVPNWRVPIPRTTGPPSWILAGTSATFGVLLLSSLGFLNHFPAPPPPLHTPGLYPDTLGWPSLCSGGLKISNRPSTLSRFQDRPPLLDIPLQAHVYLHGPFWPAKVGCSIPRGSS
jgi:hypothetical protein